MRESLKPGASCPAFLIGRFTIITSDDKNLVDAAIREMNAQFMLSEPHRVFLAIVEVAREFSGSWHEAPPGSTTIVVTCARCLARDYLPVDYDRDGKGRWHIAHSDPVTLEPSVVLCIGEDSANVCHYIVRDGVFKLLADSTPRQQTPRHGIV